MTLKHFTATTYVFNSDFSKMIFLWHPKLSSWMPPGGHIEDNESYEVAAVREIQEELGISNGWFLQPKDMTLEPIDRRAREMLMPFTILEEKINADHFHMDLIFIAKTNEQIVNSPEGHKLKWLSKEEIREEKSMLPNVRKIALKAFEVHDFKTVEFSFFESCPSI